VERWREKFLQRPRMRSGLARRTKRRSRGTDQWKLQLEVRWRSIK
jgi:hypothetical protein